jgi:hypothetical protein
MAGSKGAAAIKASSWRRFKVLEGFLDRHGTPYLTQLKINSAIKGILCGQLRLYRIR